MLNHSASLAMSTCVLKALPGKLDIKRHSPSNLYFHCICYVLYCHEDCVNKTLCSVVVISSIKTVSPHFWHADMSIQTDKMTVFSTSEIRKLVISLT